MEGEIGAAIVTRFAEAGARVVAANGTLEYAEELADGLCRRGFAVEAVAFSDVTRTTLGALVNAAAAPDGLDIVVHNAGGCRWTQLDSMSEDALDEALDLNLSSCFWLTQAAMLGTEAAERRQNPDHFLGHRQPRRHGGRDPLRGGQGRGQRVHPRRRARTGR